MCLHTLVAEIVGPPAERVRTPAGSLVARCRNPPAARLFLFIGCLAARPPSSAEESAERRSTAR